MRTRSAAATEAKASAIGQAIAELSTSSLSIAVRPVDQAIAEAPAVHDVASALRVELSAQPAGVRIERAGAAHRLEAPDVAEQLLLAEDPGGLGGQRPQE